MMRNPPPAPTPETQVENIQAKFQLELYQSDLILIDYKDELKRLQKALASQSVRFFREYIVIYLYDFNYHQ